MSTKRYKKHTEVYHDLVQMIHRNIQLRNYFLPPEIPLAQSLKTSRMTLRKAMASAEMDGWISREGKRTLINVQKHSLRSCGQILFIAPAEHSAFLHPAMERLWLNLFPEVRILDGMISCLLVDRSLSCENFEEAVENADIILLTTFIPWIGEQLQELFRFRDQKIIIALSDSYIGYCCNQIALDNTAVGRLAAQTLLHAGAKKTLILSDTSGTAHRKRVAGCRSVLHEYGCAAGLFIKRKGIPNPLFYMMCRDRVNQACGAGYDSLFLTSDEGIEVILMDLFAAGEIPKRIKVITVNGSGQALRHNPPITCVSHATQGVVAALLHRLKLIAAGESRQPFQTLIEPMIYFNATT